MLYMALEFRMQSRSGNFPFISKPVPFHFASGLLLDREMLGTHWGRRKPLPLLPATFACFILPKVTRDDDR